MNQSPPPRDHNPLWQDLYISVVNPQQLDLLLADGWRHFGDYFFRNQFDYIDEQLIPVIPLRINFNDFQLRKSQKKILKKNQDIKVVYQPALIDESKHLLFHQHKERFKRNVPHSIFNFLSENPAKKPTQVFECCLYENDNLYAVSFFDVGEKAISSIYAMFNPDFSHRSPGLHTLLLEATFAINHNKQFQYLGYAHQGQSFYDYKKGFIGLEAYNWQGLWSKFGCQST